MGSVTRNGLGVTQVLAGLLPMELAFRRGVVISDTPLAFNCVSSLTVTAQLFSNTPSPMSRMSFNSSSKEIKFVGSGADRGSCSCTGGVISCDDGA